MARKRDPNRDRAFEIFKEHNGDITNRKIGEMLGVLEKTISAWKSRDKWNVVLQNDECSTTKEKQPNRTKKKADVEEKISLIENDDLTDKQRLFCIYYTKYWNATKAYQKVYEGAYSTARTEGSRSLANPNIRSEIERLKKEVASGIMIDARAVLQKYIDVAFADIGDYVEFGTYAFTMKDLSEVDTSIIAEASNTEDGIKFKLADKMKALDFLAKYTDLLDENELKQLKVERERVNIEKTRSDMTKDDIAPIQIEILGVGEDDD